MLLTLIRSPLRGVVISPFGGSGDIPAGVGGGGAVDTTAPTITSSADLIIDENEALTHTLTADEPVDWTISGGVDAAYFSLNGVTLSMAAKNYETPVDFDANNVYLVQVTATDAGGNVDIQDITVVVEDVVVEDLPSSTAGHALGLLALTKAA